jgi:hypothetical protein
MEWLFFATKLSFLSRLTVFDQLLTWFAAFALVLVPFAALQAIATALGRIIGHRNSEAAEVFRALPSGIVASSLFLILTDNFTHTVLRFGITDSGTIVRLVYAAFVFVLLAITTRQVKQVTASPLRILRMTTRIIFVVGCVSVLWLYVTGRQESGPTVALPHPALKPNILFFASDGVSAEHTSLHGYLRDTTPFLRSFQPYTVWCENAFSNVGRTYGSLLSMLTGIPSTTTKTAFPPNLLLGQNAFDSMPALLREAGYTNVQVTMRYYADMPDANMLLAFDYANYRKVGQFIPALIRKYNAFGLLTTRYFVVQMQERLFERLGHIFAGGVMESGYRFVVDEERSPYYADTFRMDEVFRAIDETPSPWFLHVHLMDTHCCRWDIMTRWPTKDEQIDAYDRSIRRSDAYLEQIVTKLKNKGLFANTLIVISSDHMFDWDTRGKVPLLFAFPGGQPHGVVHENVQLLDVAPTILDYVGIAQPSWMTGRSILRSIPEDRPIFSLNRVNLVLNVSNPYIKQLSTPGPPWFGAASAVAVLCNQWYELGLPNGGMSSAQVIGSINNCSQPAKSPEEVRRLLLQYLQSEGFGNAASAKDF